MTRLLTLFLFTLCSQIAYSQQFEAKLSEKHIQKVDKAKTGKQKLKLYRKYFKKDSAKAAKQEKRYWKQKTDSVFKSMVKEKRAQEKVRKLESKGKLPHGTLENYDHLKKMGLSARDIVKLPKDSIGRGLLAKAKTLGTQNLEEQQNQVGDFGKFGTYKAMATDSLSIQSLQETALDQVNSKLEQEIGKNDAIGEFQEQKDGLLDLKKLPNETMADHRSQLEGFDNKIEEYQDTQHLTEKTKELAGEKAADFLAENAGQLDKVQQKVSKLMGKYRSVLNSNDLSTAVKRSSLKGRPFKERLFLGGNFNINEIRPLSLDLSPQIGYKFNTRFVVGIGGTYRKTFADTLKVSPAIPAETYGYKAFTSYDVIKSFFAYAEYERMTREVTPPNSDTNTTQWVDGLLLGVGRRFSIHPKVHMNVMVLYNFLHDSETAIYSRPWTLKFGFQLSEMALLKK